MKRSSLFFYFLIFMVTGAAAQNARQTWAVHDSVRALSFYGEVALQPATAKARNGSAGISTEGVSLFLEETKSRDVRVVMTVGSGKLVAPGIGVGNPGRLRFVLPAGGGDTGTYRLLLVKVFDSAQHFSLLSGYVFLPRLQQWKFLATVRKDGYGFIREVQTLNGPGGKAGVGTLRNEAILWGNGSARTLHGVPATVSATYWRGAADSIQQVAKDKVLIEAAIAAKKVPQLQPHQGIYFAVETPGEGRPVQVSDTVTVHYKGYLLGDTAAFDRTVAGRPARFPLGGLIRGWQVGLPLIREGGRILLVIPSGIGYSIRTRSPKIPPNSILVFEIEVVKVDR